MWRLRHAWTTRIDVTALNRLNENLRFLDLFAGLGGFHCALADLGHECVFASEIDDELRDLYCRNFRMESAGDTRAIDPAKIPSHDVLCAGFPCQPFSKAGYQLGWEDEVRGTLFGNVTEILREHRPKYVILENVGNFERHDHGNTWLIVKSALATLDYHSAVYRGESSDFTMASTLQPAAPGVQQRCHIPLISP